MLLENERPLLVELQMREREAAHLTVKEVSALVAESHDQSANRIAMNASNPLG